MDEKIKSMPKAELHCHLDGSISENVIRLLASRDGVILPGEDNAAGAEAMRAMTVAPQDCESLRQYLGCFELAVSCMQTAQNLRLAAYYLLKEVSAEHVIYIEVRFAPGLHLSRGMSLEEVVESVLAGLEQGKRELGVEYGLILCAMRHESAEKGMEVLRLAKAYLGRGVVGLDLAGDEARYPVTDFVTVFQAAQKWGLPYTIHAGEAAGADSVRNALNMGAARMGHGIAAGADRELLEECVKRQIVFEMCPSSNLQTKAAKSWEEYPFPLFWKMGLPVTINTDNRRVSNTTLTKEFELLGSHYPLTMDDRRMLTLNAIRGSFAAPEVKRCLEERLEKEWEA